MKIFLYSYFFLFLNCQSQMVKNTSMQKEEIPFEDLHHYSYSLTDKDFFIIETQDKMDEIYSIIHKKSGGRRLAPIPAISNDETFIIIKPKLKNTNDVSVENMVYEKGKIIVKIKEFNNPNINTSSRQSPNILLKLLKKIAVQKIVTQY